VNFVLAFAAYFSRRPAWGIFEQTLGLDDYTGHVNPDFFDHLTDEERELILAYNSLTPDQRRLVAVEAQKQIQTSARR
jgi:hypothetical protein